MKAKQIFKAMVLAVAVFTSSPASHAREHQPASMSGASIYQLDSQWTNQDGVRTTLDHFRGKPLVLAMAYTRCQAACPVLVMDMKRIEEALPDSLKGKVQFALFSFDSKKETPEALKSYARAHALDTRSWTLLISDQDAVRELAAALGVRYKQNAGGDFSHSNVITILNAEGEILHQQEGLRADPKESIDALGK
jgi:protein SCO1/2